MRPDSRPLVLVVDDEQIVRDSLCDELQDDFLVTAAPSGDVALGLLATHSFDAVISDVRMPGMSGVELMRRIAAIPDPPVPILLTGYVDQDAIAAASEDNGFYRLSKPWNEDLSVVLRRAVEQRRLALAARELLGKQEKAVEQLDRLATVGTMTSGILHEIRSPLACLVSDYDWLRTELGQARERIQKLASVEGKVACTSADLSRLVEVIDECGLATERIRDIVEGVRRFARGEESGDLVDLATCVEQSQRLIRHRLSLGKRLDVEIPPHLLVRGQMSRLSQVFINLMGNAIDAVDRNGHVLVRGSEHGGVAIIEVADDGPGVPPEILSHLFEPFNSSKRQAGGTGLGLSVSRQIARAIGGDIAHRRRDEGGTVFEVTLPLVGDDAPSAATRSKASP